MSRPAAQAICGVDYDVDCGADYDVDHDADHDTDYDAKCDRKYDEWTHCAASCSTIGEHLAESDFMSETR